MRERRCPVESMAWMNRSFLLVLLSASAMNAVNGFVYPVLSVRIIELGGTNLHVGLNFALPMLVNVIMYFGWGAVSDYLGKRKPVIVAGTFAGALAFFAFPYLDVWMLLTARTIQAFFFSSTVLIAAVATEHFPNNKGMSMGYLNISWGAGYAVGAFSSGPLVQYGLEFSFALCAIISMMSGAFIVPTAEQSRKSEVVELRKIFIFGERRQIAILSLAAFVLLMGNWTLFSVFPVYLYSLMENAHYSKDLATTLLGITAGFGALAGIGASYYAGPICDSRGRKSMMMFASFAYLAVWSAFIFVDDILTVVLLWTTPVWVYFNISSTSMVSDLTKERERGRGIGILNTAIGMGNFFGALLGGTIADAFSYQAVFMTTCAFTICAIVIIGFTKETLHPQDKIEVKMIRKPKIMKKLVQRPS